MKEQTVYATPGTRAVKNKIPASVGILTFNSESTLRRALESVREFDDIIICDGGSTDGTLAIAREFGAHIVAQDSAYKRPDGTLSDYGGVRNQCLLAAKHDWFLYIDSDETISDGLREDIRRIVAEQNGPLIYNIPIGIMMDGKYLKYSSNYPGYQYRFFNRRSGARFIKTVHERINFDTTKIKTDTFAHPWYIHTTREEWSHYLADNARYHKMEIAKACAEPFSYREYFQYTLWWRLRASLAVIVKASRNYLLHGFRDAVPVRGELGRAMAPLLTAWEVTACRFKKLFSK